MWMFSPLPNLELTQLVEVAEIQHNLAESMNLMHTKASLFLLSLPLSSNPNTIPEQSEQSDA